MYKAVIITIDEYNKLFEKFIDAWMDYQEKGYGCTLISNETGKKITHPDAIAGSFLLPWKKVFK